MSRKKTSIVILLSTLALLFSFNVINASTHTEVQSMAITFLTQVAGFDENSLSFSLFNISTSTLLGSNTPQIIINAILVADNQTFALAMTIIHEKIVFYRLDLLEGQNSEKTQISVEETLNVAKSSL